MKILLNMSYIIIFYDQYDSKENNIVWNAIGNATYDHLVEMYVISPESQKRLEHFLTENKIMYKILVKVLKIVKLKLTVWKIKNFVHQINGRLKKDLKIMKMVSIQKINCIQQKKNHGFDPNN